MSAPVARGTEDIIARPSIFRRIATRIRAAGRALVGREPEPPTREPPKRGPSFLPPVQPPEPPELPDVPGAGFDLFPNPYESLSPYEKVLHNEGEIMDYAIFDATGQVVIVDEYAADLVWIGWFDPDRTPDERVAAREDYFDYTGQEPRDFDWDTWKEWYADSAAA